MNQLDFIVIIGSILTVSIAIGYVLLALKSSKALNDLQNSKMVELQKSEERLISLFEHSLAGMFKFDIQNVTATDANSTFRKMMSWSEDSDFNSLAESFSKKEFGVFLEGITQNGKVVDFEIECTPLHGNKYWGLLSAQLNGDGNFAYGVLIDISKRKLFEEKNEEQAALLDETQDGVIVLDEKGDIAFWNSSAEFIYGFTKTNVIGKPLREILFKNGNAKDYDGIWTDVSRYNEWFGNLHQYKIDGSELLIDSHWKKISSKATGRDIVLIINTDITEKKKIEDMYLRAQKMETLALLTSGIAHDLQNILAPVSISIGLLKSDVTQEKSIQILNAVEESAKNGIQLLKKILTIGRGIKGENEVVDMTLLFDRLVETFSVGLPSNIILDFEYQQHNFKVMGDYNQIQQVFLNLLINARDAMPNGGNITIAAHNLDKSDFLVKEFTSKPLTGYGVFTITDTGTGIKESDLEKIFDPFFTTKSMENGTGLGLSIIQNIVKHHEGFIEVESVVGKGSTFKIYLPIIEQM
jgi:PAS domain S-box-containing protein